MTTSNAGQEQQRAIVQELRSLGFEVDTVLDLENYPNYKDAVPVLARWLPLVTDRQLKEVLYRRLTVRYAKAALPALIRDFAEVDDSDDPSGYMLRWACGNAIEALWDDEYFDDITQRLLDRRYGRAREMLVLGLAKSRRTEAGPLLVELLEDPDVAAQAVIALRKHRPEGARARLQALRPEQKRWVQKEIDKTLAKLSD